MNELQQGLSYNDISIIPAMFTEVNSRSECSPFYKENLPIFTAPMSTIVGLNSFDKYKNNHIIPIIPRNENIEARKKHLEEGNWVAVSLNEFKNLFIKEKRSGKVCIDIANGHMKTLYELCKDAKEVCNDLTIMVGNIANPNTYSYITEMINKRSGYKLIDYIRVGIGSGSQCTTSSNTGIHFPMASLIWQCAKFKEESSPKLIADGGIRNYSDVIKALALGADYVMIGGLFGSLYESESKLCIKVNSQYEEVLYEYTSEDKKKLDIRNRDLYKECYGMSTRKAQALIGKSHKTAEGKHSYIKVTHTISQWSNNMIDYLKSAMSYCDAFYLSEFIGKPDIIINSIGTLNVVNK